MNSPNYFTVYPPVCQAIFTFSCYFFPNSVYGSAVLMKCFLFCFEVGSIFFLLKLFKHFGLSSKRVLLYALNPLIIIETVCNLHFESAMIFFLLLGWWCLIRKWWVLSAIAIALSIASKLLPLMFLPFLIRRLGWKRSLSYFTLLGISLILLFAPLISNTFVNNFGDSLNLYYQRFEFNAGIYYLLRWLGFKISGYNMIQLLGPLLALFASIFIIWRAIREKSSRWSNLGLEWLLAISAYVLCTTTMHPWYTALPIVFCLFTRFRYPIVWSGLIFLTYINYSYSPYLENLWIVGIEYLLLFGFIFWEVVQGRIISSQLKP